MSGQLILVGTPIGNLSDCSERAKAALADCDFIAAEDTRVTGGLLHKFGIKKPMISYYEHNRREKGQLIVERILSGETCCLVTDAGMPAISDPGEELVALCAGHGVNVSVVPGPSAVVTALAISGLPTGRFTFEGFLSVSKKSRFEHLNSLITECRTMIFYEAPHKLPATLTDMLKTFGDRRISIVREVTKLHEEVIRTSLSEAALHFSAETPRGEIVLVLEGARSQQRHEMTLADAVSFAMELRKKGLSASAAARESAAVSGQKKTDIYKALMR